MNIAYCGLSVKGNPEQAELARLIQDNTTKIIYCIGNAGTGKTIVSLAAAIEDVEINKKYGKRGKIYYVREPVEVGKSLGYLPGGIDEKFDAYLEGLRDNLIKLEDIGGMIKAENELEKIECIPPQYLRGASKDQCIIIVDEAQNMSLNTIKTILTRVGDYTKVVLLGSTNQIDTKGITKKDNDFMKTYNKLKDLSYVGFVELIQSKRSAFCAEIDARLSEDE